VLTFFASWCHPCEEEMPLLEDAWTDDPDRFGVLAVSYDDLERDSRAFVERLGVTYPAVLDLDDQVKDAYGVGAIPQTFFVDANGVLQDRVFGITSRDALDDPLDQLLATNGDP
jgi:cytochrome c biogenesis protein CcmG/thiol:disulfide interchange protein DsbE